MSEPAVVRRSESPRFHAATLRVSTAQPLEFVDLTDAIAAEVRKSRVASGIVNVQTRHTTTAIVVNENEPLLLEDLRELLEQWAPAHGRYRHDRFDIRTVNLTPGERINGHSHARAVPLRTSETLNVAGGRIDLGRWQRILLVELDGPREREISIAVLGLSEG